LPRIGGARKYAKIMAWQVKNQYKKQPNAHNVAILQRRMEYLPTKEQEKKCKDTTVNIVQNLFQNKH
jgi:hypothetical protein